MIRAVEPEDLDLMYLIENDQTLWPDGSQTVPVSHYQLKQYIAESSADIYKDGQVRFTICDENAVACGFVDLTDFDAKNMRAQVGIVLTRDSQGRGLASAALKGVAGYARSLGFVQLWAVVACDNESARSLFERNGYRKTATLERWIISGQKQKDGVLYQFYTF